VDAPRTLAVLAGPRIRRASTIALALASVGHVQVLSCTMPVAVSASITRWWHRAVSTCEAVQAAAHAAIRLVKILCGAMATAVVIWVAWRRRRAICACVLVGARALATVRGIQVLGGSVSTAVILGITDWWH
jgi:hypothetical protein